MHFCILDRACLLAFDDAAYAKGAPKGDHRILTIFGYMLAFWNSHNIC